MLKQFLSKINRPLPGWLTLVLILSTGAAAAIPIFTGSLVVPSTGSLSNYSGTTALDATGTNTITSNTTGTVAALAFNASNAISTTGDLFDVQLKGVNEFRVLNGGGIVPSGPVYAPSSGLYINGSPAAAGILNLNLFPLASGYAVYMESFSALNNAHFPDAGGLVLDRGSLTAGSSSFGPTLVSSNGLVKSTAGAANNDFEWACTNGAGLCDLAGNSAVSVSGVAGSVLCLNNNTNTSAGSYLCADSSGNLGIGGALKAGGATYGPISASVPGPLTAIGVSATTGTVQGSSNGSATSYLPPVYTETGTAVASTDHGVQGTWTCTTTSLPSTGYYYCAQLITFSGAAIFTSASSYACKQSIYSETTTGVFTYYNIPAIYPYTQSGTQVSIGVYVNVVAFTTAGTVTIDGTYSCSGT